MIKKNALTGISFCLVTLPLAFIFREICLPMIRNLMLDRLYLSNGLYLLTIFIIGTFLFTGGYFWLRKMKSDPNMLSVKTVLINLFGFILVFMGVYILILTIIEAFKV